MHTNANEEDKYVMQIKTTELRYTKRRKTKCEIKTTLIPIKQLSISSDDN